MGSDSVCGKAGTGRSSHCTTAADKHRALLPLSLFAQAVHGVIGTSVSGRQLTVSGQPTHPTHYKHPFEEQFQWSGVHYEIDGCVWSLSFSPQPAGTAVQQAGSMPGSEGLSQQCAATCIILTEFTYVAQGSLAWVFVWPAVCHSIQLVENPSMNSER
jgi:hypothetical protein